MIFQAIISEKTTIKFTFQDLINPNPVFSIRELLIPWLRRGNIPTVYHGLSKTDIEYAKSYLDIGKIISKTAKISDKPIKPIR